VRVAALSGGVAGRYEKAVAFSLRSRIIEPMVGNSKSRYLMIIAIAIGAMVAAVAPIFFQVHYQSNTLELKNALLSILFNVIFFGFPYELLMIFYAGFGKKGGIVRVLIGLLTLLILVYWSIKSNELFYKNIDGEAGPTAIMRLTWTPIIQSILVFIAAIVLLLFNYPTDSE
jgi:hypothetical protein